MAANRAFAGFLLGYLLVNICLIEHKLCSNYVQVYRWCSREIRLKKTDTLESSI